MTALVAFLASWWAYLPLGILWAAWTVHTVRSLREGRVEEREFHAHVASVHARGEANADDVAVARGLAERAHARLRATQRWGPVTTFALAYSFLVLGVSWGTTYGR